MKKWKKTGKSKKRIISMSYRRRPGGKSDGTEIRGYGWVAMGYGFGCRAINILKNVTGGMVYHRKGFSVYYHDRGITIRLIRSPSSSFGAWIPPTDDDDDDYDTKNLSRAPNKSSLPFRPLQPLPVSSHPFQSLPIPSSPFPSLSRARSGAGGRPLPIRGGGVNPIKFRVRRVYNIIIRKRNAGELFGA